MRRLLSGNATTFAAEALSHQRVACLAGRELLMRARALRKAAAARRSLAHWATVRFDFGNAVSHRRQLRSPRPSPRAPPPAAPAAARTPPPPQLPIEPPSPLIVVRLPACRSGGGTQVSLDPLVEVPWARATHVQRSAGGRSGGVYFVAVSGGCGGSGGQEQEQQEKEQEQPKKQERQEKQEKQQQ